MPLHSAFDARLVTARMLAPGVRELTFERVDGLPMAFEAGQWCNVLLPIAYEGNSEIKRSYSIASSPDGSPRFEIAVTRVQQGPGSTWLHEMQPGQIVPFSGPHGFFTRAAANAPPSLMIATGTGVTPMRSMLRAAMSAEVPFSPTIVLLGVRHEEDLLYRDEFEALASRHPSVRFEATLSRPHESWRGRRGYVQTHVRELWSELAARGGEPHAYVCGLERMVGSVREILRQELEVPRQRVHSERYD